MANDFAGPGREAAVEEDPQPGTTGTDVLVAGSDHGVLLSEALEDISLGIAGWEPASSVAVAGAAGAPAGELLCAVFAGLLGTDAKRLAALEAVSGAGEAPSAFAVATLGAVVDAAREAGRLEATELARAVVPGGGTAGPVAPEARVRDRRPPASLAGAQQAFRHVNGYAARSEDIPAASVLRAAVEAIEERQYPAREVPMYQLGSDLVPGLRVSHRRLTLSADDELIVGDGAPTGGLPRSVADVRRAIEKKMAVLRLASSWVALCGAGWDGAGEVAPAQVMAARDADELMYAPVCAAMHTLMQVLSPDVQEAIGQVVAFEKEAEQASLVAAPEVKLASILEQSARTLPMLARGYASLGAALSANGKRARPRGGANAEPRAAPPTRMARLLGGNPASRVPCKKWQTCDRPCQYNHQLGKEYTDAQAAKRASSGGKGGKQG